MTKRIILWALLPVSIFLVMWEAPLALGKKIVLFSAVSGQLVDMQGNPRPGVKIRQNWREKPRDPATVEEVVTDAQGRFAFPERSRSSLMALLPGTLSVRQQMIADGPEGEVILWQMVKVGDEPLAETGGRPLDLVCVLDAEEDASGPAWGTCRFAGKNTE